ncbi:acetolactate synthase small subunit [Bacillota bacterium Meth-B3]
MDARQFILSVLVNNEAGVLTRVSGLFARRSFNIDSLSVAVTQDPQLSRITIAATGDDYLRQQIVKQLEKLHDVRVVQVMDPERTVVRELMLIKIRATHEQRSRIQEAVSVFRAKVVDLSQDSMIVELTGEKSKIDAFFELLTPYEVTELCRTGMTAIGRSGYILHNDDKEC